MESREDEESWEQGEQDMSDEENDYGAGLWSEDCSNTDYEDDPTEGDPEPEPPDHQSTIKCYPHLKKSWYEEGISTRDSWLESDYSDNSEGSEEECYYKSPPQRKERSYHTFVYNPAPSYTTSAGSEKQNHKRGVPKTKSLTFSGYTKDPEDYLQWETNMKQWLRNNNIPKEEKLSCAVEALAGDAYKWWLKECTPGFYNKPVLDWGDLKARMYREFVKKYQTRRNTTTKSMYQTTSRSMLYAPHLQQVRTQKFAYVPELKKVIPNTFSKRPEAKHSVQVKENPQRPISAPLLEPQGKVPQGKSSNFVNSKEPTCYRCHNRGHFATTCPSRKLSKDHSSPELKSEISRTSDSLSHSDILISSSRLIHLSLPKDSVSGLSHTPTENRSSISLEIQHSEMTTSLACQGMKNDHSALKSRYTVSRSKPFQEGEYDEDIKSSSTKEHRTRSLEEASMKLRRAMETCELSSAQVEAKIKYPSSTNIWRSYSTHIEFTTKKNQPEKIPDEEDIEDTFWKAFNGLYGDLRSLIESFRYNQEDLSYKSNCSSFSTHHSNTENRIRVNQRSDQGVINFTNRVNRNFPDLDIGALIGRLRPNQKEISYKSTCYGILTQPGSSSNWNHINTGFSVEVIQLLNRMILSLPYLETHGFNKLQTRLWRPGERSKHPGDSSRHLGGPDNIFPCTRAQRIRRILTLFYLPYMEAFTLRSITHQRLSHQSHDILELFSGYCDVLSYTKTHQINQINQKLHLPFLDPFAIKIQRLHSHQDYCILGFIYDDQNVPKKLTYTLKPSRYKANITALESSHLTTQIFQRLYSLLSRFLNLLDLLFELYIKLISVSFVNHLSIQN